MYTIQFIKSGVASSFYPDRSFKFTDRLNAVNEANFVFSSSNSFHRSQLSIGSSVYISEKDLNNVTSSEFYGFVDDIQTVDQGGMNVHAIGQEAWLGKQLGTYASSPWTTTSTVTIFDAIIGESSHITVGSSDAFGNITFRESQADSLWNAIMNLNKITNQDEDTEYSNSGATIALKNNRGLSYPTSRATFNQYKEIGDIAVGRSMPIANSITVYGMGEGQTRITSDPSHGQDAGSQAIWGILSKPITNYSISNVDAANKLADAEVTVYSSEIKTYQFSLRVKKFRTDFIAGDIITLNSVEHGLVNEQVTITEIEKGVTNGQEYMNLTVTNSEYARQVKNNDMINAQAQLNAQNSSVYNQYQAEYSNQNVDTCVGGIAAVKYLGGLPYLYMNSGSTINTKFLDVNVITVAGLGSPQIYMFGNKICALGTPTDDYEAAKDRKSVV